MCGVECITGFLSVFGISCIALIGYNTSPSRDTAAIGGMMDPHPVLALLLPQVSKQTKQPPFGDLSLIGCSDCSHTLHHGARIGNERRTGSGVSAVSAED